MYSTQSVSRRAASRVAAFRASVVVAAAATFFAACSDSVTGPKTAAVPAGLQRTLDSIVTASNVPGAIVTVRLANGSSYSLTSGVADLSSKRPISANDHMRMGSITKAMVATVVLSLVDDGRIALDQRVSQYLPGIAPTATRMTVRQLLNHSDGLASYTDDEAFLVDLLSDPTRSWTPSELLNIALRSPIIFEPGAPGKWSYSNTSYTVLGMIVEAVTGRSLAQELQARVFSKAGMTESSYPTTVGMPAPFAEGYIDLSDTELNMAVGALMNPSWAGAAGAVVSTTRDIARFVEALASGTLISAASATAQRQVAAGSLFRFAGESFDINYGLGVMIGDGWIGHNGAIPGYEAEAHAKPGVGSIAVAINRTGNAQTTRDIFTAVRKAQFGK